MPHGTYVRFRPYHVAFRQGIGHATYVRPKPSHMAPKHDIGHATWHIG